MKKELTYARMLESTGLTRDHAEIHLKVIEGAMQDNVVTKSDLKDEVNSLRTDFKSEFQEVRTEIQEVRIEIQDVRTELKADIQDLRNESNLLEHRIISKLGLIISAVAATSTTILGGFAAILKFAF